MEMDLQINIRKNGTTSVIDLTGEVDAYTSARFREIMLELIDDGGTDLVINMCKVEYIDSSGLGALVGGLKRVSERDGKIVIVCDGPQVRKVFEITGLEKVFPIYGVEEAALEAIRGYAGSKE
ncbi:MAG: STAS domain-containing protein [Armatimonadota bacterium]|nr:STAS domain-containing protein [bacterium]